MARATVAAAVLVLCASGATAQPAPGAYELYPAGCTYDTRTGGGDCLVMRYGGDLPLVVSAPHGGTYEPRDIPVRTPRACGGSAAFNTATDINLARVTRNLVIDFRQNDGRSPWAVIMLLDRTKVDANRPLASGACGNPTAVAAWIKYHEWIREAISLATADDRVAVYVDLHGHGFPEQRIQADYALPREQLTAPHLDDLAPYSTLAPVADLTRIPFSTLLRDLGSRLTDAGYPTVPSAYEWTPGPGERWMGTGYSLVWYGQSDPRVAGIQLELHYHGLRDSLVNRTRFSAALRGVLREYLAQFGVTW